MSELTFRHEIMDKLLKPAKFPMKIKAPVLVKPYRAHVHHEPDGEKVRVSLPCARYNWTWAPFVYLILVCPWGLWFSWSMGFAVHQRRFGGWDMWPMLVGIAVLAGGFYLLVCYTYPRIAFEATKEGVIVGQFKFEWENLHGVRLGYDAGGKERQMKQGPYHGLRMKYGPWGFDLPYMVNGYYAAAYVVWLNMMLQTVHLTDPEERINSPEDGFKKDLF